MIVDPTSAHSFVHPEGEVITAAGTGMAGTLYESQAHPLRDFQWL